MTRRGTQRPSDKKPGRPRAEEKPREVMTVVAFRADSATMAALAELLGTDEAQGDRSMVIRKAILAAAKKPGKIPKL